MIVVSHHKAIISINYFIIEKILSCDLITAVSTYISIRERFPSRTYRIPIMSLKPGPKRIAESTGKPDQRQRDNKNTPGNTPDLKPSKSSKK